MKTGGKNTPLSANECHNLKKTCHKTAKNSVRIPQFLSGNDIFGIFAVMKPIYIILTVLAMSNILFLILFIHSRWAYRKLMQKSLETEEKKNALVETASYNIEVVPDEQERRILRDLQKAMEQEKVFLDPTISVQDLAKRLGTNRTSLSHIINTHLNQNFASLLNSYRIKEAVNLLSDPQHFDDKMEAVGEMCGYNNRQVFHAAFKKEMGITPNHFRNINKRKATPKHSEEEVES